MNPSDLIAVFDEYLKRSGVGKNYMADKIFKLFNNKNSPFNIDGKLIKNLENSIDDFTKKIKAFKIPNLNAFVKGINGAVDNVKDFRDSFKITGLYAFNIAMEGALKNVRDFRDSFKITGLYAFDVAMEGALKNVRTFRDNLKIPSFSAFKIAMEGALKNVRTFRDNLKIPSLNAFKIAMEGALKNARGFRDNLKITGFYAFDVAMKGALREVRTFRDNLKVLNKSLSGGLGSLGTEAAVGTPTIVDVRLVDISQNAEDILTRIFQKDSNKNNTQDKDKDKDKDKGSFIGKLIKGILGTIAFVAGVGFISEFLDTPIGRGIKGVFTNLKNKFVEMLKPFLKKIIDYSIEGLKVLFFELPKYFLKQTFNFFGLKEILGKENEGLAVLLTKGIYYGVKNAFVGVLNKFSFGGFSKLLKFIKPAIDFIPTTLGKIFSEIGNKLIGTLTRPFSILKNSFNIVKSSGSSILGKIQGFSNVIKMIPKTIMDFFKGFGTGGGIGKVLSSIAKFSGGSIFKLLGTMFKNIAKKIPFIGGLISFKDAYDRIKNGDLIGGLISIGSGIASFFPGIGTAISIGLDVLNMFLDKKAADPNSAVSKIKNFIKDISSKIANAFISIFSFIKDIPSKIKNTVTAIFNFYKDILNMLNPLNWGKKLWDWVANKMPDVKDLINFFGSIINSIIEKVKGVFEFITDSVSYAFTMITDFAKQKFEELKNWIKNAFNSDEVYGDVYDKASTVYSPNLKPPTDAEIEEFKESQKRLKVQRVEDGIITKNKVVVPSSSDDVVMAKNGGPFDLAFREMNQKLEQLSVIFAQGTELIANSTIQGSSSVAQAVVSTGGKQSPIVIAGKDPIADFRERANRFI